MIISPKNAAKLKKLVVKLLKPKTWIDPKNIYICVIVSIVAPASCVISTKTFELIFERNFKILSISAKYEPIQFLKKDTLQQYLALNDCGKFNPNLDDDIYPEYLLIPIKIKNTSHYEIQQAVSFDVDLGCSETKIIDVRTKVVFPKLKIFSGKTTLPKLMWSWPTNGHNVELGFTLNDAAQTANLYCSMNPDAGFGKINAQPITDSKYSFLYIPIGLWHEPPRDK